MRVRHRLLISFGFLALAGLIASSASAVAQNKPQSPGQHESIQGTYTPDEIKAALERFSKGGGMPDLPPGLLDMLKKMEGGGKKLDDKQMKEMLEKDPEFRRKMEEFGKRFRNNGGKAPPLTKEEIERVQQMIPKNGIPPNGGPFQGPPNGGKREGPNGAPMGGGPPPALGKGDPGALPKTLDPMIPNGGNPMLPPNVPMPPGANPGPPPKIDFKPPNEFDPNQSPRDRAAHAAASLWERNIGPLDDTPAVKRALFDLVEGTEDIKDENGQSFWDEISAEQGDSTSLADLINGAAMGDAWSFSKIDLPSFNWSLSSTSSDLGSSSSGGESWWQRNFGGNSRPPSSSNPRMPSSGGGGFNIGVPGMEGSWLPVVILAVLLFGSLLAWRLWSLKTARAAAAFALGGPGWPIDPRRITTREHVVIAFEYLSVMICGPVAKTWTHNTIAGALADLATTHGETAMLLARLYELARYAPLDEPLTTSELTEARRLVCTLAGLEHE
jgi:hypothetical protein